MNPQFQLLLLKILASAFLAMALLAGGEVAECVARSPGQCRAAWNDARLAVSGAITTLLAYMVPNGPGDGGGGGPVQRAGQAMSDSLRRLRESRDEEER